jgi:K+-sensing histidine kinase KdpD
MGDATLLTKALAALLAEAFDRAPAGTRVELSLTHDRPSREAVLAIRHEGAGPTAAARAQVHQHSFSQQMFGADHLGLALVAKVCRLHGMRLRFDRANGQGSRMSLTMKTAVDASCVPASKAMTEANLGLRKALR